MRRRRRDTGRKNCYRAEWNFPLDRGLQFETIEDHRAYVEAILEAEGERPIQVVWTRRATRTSRAFSDKREIRFATGSTRARQYSLNELTTLHEVAHILDYSGGAAHGRRWRRVFFRLVETYMGPEYRAALVDGYIRFGAEVPGKYRPEDYGRQVQRAAASRTPSITTTKVRAGLYRVPEAGVEVLRVGRSGAWVVRNIGAEVGEWRDDLLPKPGYCWPTKRAALEKIEESLGI